MKHMKASTQHRKAMSPATMLAAMRKLGMTDQQIKEFLERVRPTEGLKL